MNEEKQERVSWWMSDEEVDCFELKQQKTIVGMSNYMMRAFKDLTDGKNNWDEAAVKEFKDCMATLKVRREAVKLAADYRAAVIEKMALLDPATKHQSKDDFYKSRQWQRLRYQVLSKSTMSCELCGAHRRDGAILHVDHIEPRSLRPDLELDVDNLQVLCEPCNIGKSNKDNTDFRPKIVVSARGL